MAFFPSSAPTLKAFNVSYVVSINFTITLNSVWFYFVPYISFAITATPFAVSHCHSPSHGCWSQSSQQALQSPDIFMQSALTGHIYCSFLANSSSLIDRMRSAFVFWTKCGHFLLLVFQHIVHELFFLQFTHSSVIFIIIHLSEAVPMAAMR